MLPTPAIADWSSRKDFSGAVRPAAISPSNCGVKAAESGSTPSRSKRRGSSTSSIRNASPKRRGSVNQSSLPSVEPKASPQVALGDGALALIQTSPRGIEHPTVFEQDQVAGHPQVHDQGLATLESQQAGTCRAAAAPRSNVRSAQRQTQAATAGATSAHRAPRGVRFADRLFPARAGGIRSRPRAARASPGFSRSVQPTTW